MYEDLLIDFAKDIFDEERMGLLLCNKKGEILYGNASFRNLFGKCKSVFTFFPDFPLISENPFYLQNKRIYAQIKQLNFSDIDLSCCLLNICPEWEDSYSPLLLKALYMATNLVSDGFSVVDASGRFIYYNKGLEELEGYDSQEVVGRHVTEIYDVTPETSQLLRCMKEKQIIRESFQHYSMKNKRSFDIIIEAYPIFSNGEIIGALDIYHSHEMLGNLVEKYYYLKERQQKKSYRSEPTDFDREQMSHHGQIIGNNVKLQESLNIVRAASKSNSPVLIYGETGTGKELYARAIHENGARKENPFIAINCAAIPESLLESMLFGTVKGAFTGATNMAGFFEQANGGTIFLDEINSMPLALQAKILRVLEEKKVRRLGDTKEIFIDSRVISSTNYPPKAAIEENIIRPDLFYRLSVFYVTIPPLRERIDDIELLASYFVDLFNKEMNKQIIGIAPEIINAFKEYSWPGNIRQLRNIIDCAMNFVDEKERMLQKYHIPRYIDIFTEKRQQIPVSSFEWGEYSLCKKTNDSEKNFNMKTELQYREKDIIRDALRNTNGNITHAAANIGISRQSLQYKMKKYCINKRQG